MRTANKDRGIFKDTQEGFEHLGKGRPSKEEVEAAREALGIKGKPRPLRKGLLKRLKKRSDTEE